MKLQVTLLFLLASVHSSQQGALRPTSQYNVEVYFVADKKAQSLYLKECSSTAAAKSSMEADIDYFLTEVNKRYQSLDEIDIVISRRKLDILDIDIFNSSDILVEDVIKSSTAINAFDIWLAEEGAHIKLEYDVAMLWTGYDLASKTRATGGYAYVGTVCKGAKATSVVEYDGTYRTVVNTAHEIAHNLGAIHDSGNAGYVMAPTTSPSSSNRWNFSLCSGSDIKGALSQLQHNCLLETSDESDIPKSTITEKLRDPNAICARKGGEQSYLCHSRNLYNNSFPQGDNVCQKLWCFHGDGCGSTVSSDGLTCGKGKTCQEGKCKVDESPNAENVDEFCLYGDQKQVNFKIKGQPNKARTCEEFLNATSDRYCMKDAIRTLCCKTCKERSTGSITCPYGDGSPQCSKFKPSQICWHPDNAAVCCGTCEGYKGKGRGRRSAGFPFIIDEWLPTIEDPHVDDHVTIEELTTLVNEQFPHAED